MKLDSRTKIIVFNPKPDDVLRNLNEEIPRDRVIKIPQYFGTSEGNEALRTLRARGV